MADFSPALRGLAFALRAHALPALEAAGDLSDLLPAVSAEAARSLGGDDALRTALDELADAPPGELHAAATEAAEAAAGDQPEAVRRRLAGYLELVPRTARASRAGPGRTATLTRSLRGRPDSDDSTAGQLPRRVPRFRPGDRPPGLGDWVLVELLGAGGFGEVWMARHGHFDGIPPVALKFCLDTAAKDRLLRHEAHVLNQVMRAGTHPGVVPLMDALLDADPPCLKYEYVPGGDLAGLAAAWPPPPDPGRVALASRAVRDLAETVGHMHRLDPPVVHRDLKPGNVLVQPGEGGPRLRVADFGIGGVAGTTGLDDSGLRRAHTPLYASPQQRSGATPDPRDDVHALGVIWFQLLAGDFHTGPTVLPAGEWRAVLGEAGVPGPLAAILAACVSADPDARPADGAALADALTVALTPADEGPVPGYRVLAPIPAPGPAALYTAERRSDGKTVALKVLAVRSPGGAEAADAFRREAELLTGLDHPNVIRAYEHGEHAGELFLAMEYVAGSTLDRVCRTGPQPPGAVVALFEELARAAGYLHGRGVVHRDLRPGSVLLLLGEAGGEGPGRAYGTPKLIDFMRAARTGEAGAAGGGTPAYLAPELTHDPTASDPRADVWALGVMLYEALSGRVPFQGMTVADTVARVRSAEPEPLRRVRPEVPAGLAAVVSKCLAKPPGARHPDGSALADALASWRRARAAGWWGWLRGVR